MEVNGNSQEVHNKIEWYIVYDLFVNGAITPPLYSSKIWILYKLSVASHCYVASFKSTYTVHDYG